MRSAVTSGSGDGDRIVDAGLETPEPEVVATMAGPPVWVVATPTTVAVADDLGRVWLGSLGSGDVELTEVVRIARGQPPTLVDAGAGWQVLLPPDDASALSSPVALSDGRLAYVTGDGGLVVGDERIGIGALPDARPVTDGTRVVVLGRATDQYGHGVLGDAIEASALFIHRTGADGTPALHEISLRDDEVIEGIAPTLADPDGDGDLEAIVTVSTPSAGARIDVVELDSGQSEVGEPIGSGSRWRHVIGVAPGEGGQREIVEVVTPHLARTATWHRRTGNGYRVAAELSGELTTHGLGSRNLDQGLLVDVDGDGRVDLLGHDGQDLVALGRQGSRARVVARVTLGSRLATNLAGAVVDGRAVVVFGTEDGRIWLWR